MPNRIRSGSYVLGCALIGAAACTGAPVESSPGEALLERPLTAWSITLNAFPANLKVNGLSPGASADRLTFAPSLKDALAGADFVQENAPERPDFKIKLFADMDDATPPDSILASSSSGITPDIIQGTLPALSMLGRRAPSPSKPICKVKACRPAAAGLSADQQPRRRI